MVDLRMTLATWRDPRTGQWVDAEPVTIMVDRPASSGGDLTGEADEFVELISEALPPEMLTKILARLAAVVADRSSILTVFATVTRGLEDRSC